MPNLDEATTTDLMSAWGTLIGGSATAVAATAGVAAALAAVRTLKATKRDSRNRSRPMVGALLERDPHPNAKTASLVIRNYGQAVAFGVSVKFDPPLVDGPTVSTQPSMVPFILDRYRKPIASFMPGVQLTNIWFLGHRKDGKLVNDMPIPEQVTVRIRYADKANFWANDANRYEDEFVIDTSILRAETTSTHSDDHLGLHKRTVKALENIAPNMRQIATDIHQIEDDVKPDHVRERQAAEYAESKRRVDEMRADLFRSRTDAEPIVE